MFDKKIISAKIGKTLTLLLLKLTRHFSNRDKCSISPTSGQGVNSKKLDHFPLFLQNVIIYKMTQLFEVYPLCRIVELGASKDQFHQHQGRV